MPIEGIVVEGPHPLFDRTAADFNIKLTEAVDEIVRRQGTILLQQSVLCEFHNPSFKGIHTREDVHLVVNFPDSSEA